MLLVAHLDRAAGEARGARGRAGLGVRGDEAAHGGRAVLVPERHGAQGGRAPEHRPRHGGLPGAGTAASGILSLSSYS